MKKKKKSNKWLYIIAGLVVVLLVGGLFAKKQGWIGGKKGQEVVFGEVQRVEIVEKVSASGKIQPEVEIKISPDVSGEITELHIAEGDSVTIGQLLLKIRPDNYESAVAQAGASLNTQRANLSQAKARISQNTAQFVQSKTDYERNEGLFKQGVISQQELQTAKTSFEVAKSNLESAKQSVEASRYTVVNAEASLKQARETLSLTSVYAPMNGIVSKLTIEKGERVVGTSQMQGTEMLRIAELQNMEVRVDVNENDIIRVSLGDTVLVDVDAYSDEEFKGLVMSIANSANDAQLSADAVTEFEVKIRILNNSYQHLVTAKRRSPFRPGMTASVEIITERKQNVLAVPLSAVTTRSDKDKKRGGKKGKGEGDKKKEEKKAKGNDKVKEVVFVENEGRVRKQEVKTGISDFDHIEILKGLKEGDKIVTGPFLTLSKKLKDDDRVIEQEKGGKGKRRGKKD
jgi:HlyD family secretion protein